MNKTKLPLFVFNTILFTCLTVSLIACSCRPPGAITYEDYIGAGVIFEGIAINVVEDKDNWSRVVTFQVTDQIKTKQSTVIIETALDGAMCGLGITEGSKWYIWGRKLENGNFGSGICTRSMFLPEDQSAFVMDRYEADKKFIKELKSKKGKQTFKLEDGTATGKMKNGMRCGKWRYYDQNNTLIKTCKYKKDIEKSCTEVDNPTM